MTYERMKPYLERWVTEYVSGIRNTEALLYSLSVEGAGADVPEQFHDFLTAFRHLTYYRRYKVAQRVLLEMRAASRKSPADVDAFMKYWGRHLHLSWTDRTLFKKDLESLVHKARQNTPPKVGENVEHPAYGVCKVQGVTLTVGGLWGVYARTKKGLCVFFVGDDAIKP